jgi:glycine cleavage system H lipoate-binding protein
LKRDAVIEGLKYMPSHEWAKVEGDVATVGITDHAQVRKTKHSTQGAPQATETTGEGGWAITRAIGIVV